MREYTVIIGSKSFFTEKSENFANNAPSFLDLIRQDDDRRRTIAIKQTPPEVVDQLIVYNTDYHGIVESAHDRLGELIRGFTSDDAHIYIHNPPARLLGQLQNQSNEKLIILRIEREEYDISREPAKFLEHISNIKRRIIGQDSAIDDIAKSIWYLTNVKRKKPYVIMLYGNSSLGKTELVREISAAFFNSKFMEKHLSMFKNENYADYFFGNSPNRSSIGYELLERESNLVFFDELDKCPNAFYSAFYSLFDNTLFKDYSYDVDISGLCIILTSNYISMEQMRNELGLPIFYRIDKFVHFEDFNAAHIHEILIKEISDRENEYSTFFTKEKLYSVVSKRVNIAGENARTIKSTVQFAIEDMMFQSINPKG